MYLLSVVYPFIFQIVKLLIILFRKLLVTSCLRILMYDNILIHSKLPER